jgi:hypothetical protein
MGVHMIDSDFLRTFINGAITALHWVIAVFFFRFWHRTKAKLFLAFAIAFGILGLERLAVLENVLLDARNPYTYILRLFAFSVIMIAVIYENR